MLIEHVTHQLVPISKPIHINSGSVLHKPFPNSLANARRTTFGEHSGLLCKWEINFREAALFFIHKKNGSESGVSDLNKSIFYMLSYNTEKEYVLDAIVCFCTFAPIIMFLLNLVNHSF